MVEGGTGDNYLEGDISANTIVGRSGDDNLYGGSGGDVLIGGVGNDTSIGGDGNDDFRFNSPSEGSSGAFVFDVEQINDFNNVAGNNDRIVIDASGFGGGLTPGATLPLSRFETSSTNAASNGSVRFIFETDERFLWFDVDGSGSAAPVLLAEIGGSVPVLNSDIFIVA